MAKVVQECPECGSGMVSIIGYWRPNRGSKIDTMFCHDCKNQYDPLTNEAKPSDWSLDNMYSNKVKNANQVTLFDGIKDMRAVVIPVPKLIESPSGATVVVHKIPADSPKGYAEEVANMAAEFNQVKRTQRPDWWKYRKIKTRS